MKMELTAQKEKIPNIPTQSSPTDVQNTALDNEARIAAPEQTQRTQPTASEGFLQRNDGKIPAEMICREILEEADNPNILNDYLPPLKKVNLSQLKARVRSVNQMLENVQIADVMELIKVCKGVAKVITKEFNPKKRKCETDVRNSENKVIPNKPMCLVRIERSMDELFGDIDRLHKFQRLKRPKREGLVKKYRLTETNRREIIEICKQRLQALKAKRQRYLKAADRKQQNSDFKYNRKRLFNEMLGKSSVTDEAPDKTESETFWKNIWDKEETEVTNDSILNEVSSFIKNKANQEAVIITLSDLKEQLRRTPNWKATGLDGLHGFWIKTSHSYTAEWLYY